MTKYFILVADDMKGLRSMAVRSLEGVGFSDAAVYSACDGQEALEQFIDLTTMLNYEEEAKEADDAVVIVATDYDMPIKGGDDLLRDIDKFMAGITSRDALQVKKIILSDADRGMESADIKEFRNYQMEHGETSVLGKINGNSANDFLNFLEEKFGVRGEDIIASHAEHGDYYRQIKGEISRRAADKASGAAKEGEAGAASGAGKESIDQDTDEGTSLGSEGKSVTPSHVGMRVSPSVTHLAGVDQRRRAGGVRCCC